MNAQGLIQFEEGRRNVAYRDTLGLWTNGIGHKYTDSLDHTGDTWTDEEVDQTFEIDYASKLRELGAACPWIASLDEVRRAVLISMAFQMGVHGVLQFVHTLAAIRDQRWNDAAGGIRASAWYTQTRARAERAARAIETGEWQVS
jgi:lysozyme